MPNPNRKPRQGSAAVTLKDVARRAGVSAMTVSRALNRPGSVDAQMEARVRDAVAALGYLPNRMASGLRGSQTRLVAAVFPSLGGPVFLQLIDSLGHHLALLGHQLLVGQSGYQDDSREDDLLCDVIARRPDGIVLTGVAHTEGSRRRLLASGIPVVETWDLTLDPIGLLVGFSHEAVGRAVADLFHARGRRHFAYVGAHDPRSMRRAAAFGAQAALQGCACQPPRYVEVPSSVSGGRRLLREALAAEPRTDAVFCSSDFVALGVITEAWELGLRVPQDLMVMGFGDLAVGREISPSISSVHIDTDRIGRISAAWIVDRALPEGVQGQAVDVGFSLVERETTGSDPG